MRYYNFLFLFVLAALISFSACKQDEFSEEMIEEEQIEAEETSNNNLVFRMESTSSADDGLDLGCFTIPFPFTLVVDGVPFEINSEADFDNIDENATYVDFLYPLNIISPEGETSQIEDGEALGEAFASCIPDQGWEEDGFPAFLISDLDFCYSLNYPVTLIDPDGATYAVPSEEAFIELMVDNPVLYFQFPIELMDEEGETVSVESDEALFDLLLSCDQGSEPIDTAFVFTWSNQIGCYEIQFPVTVIVDGENISVADENELISYLFSGEITGFGYPLNLIDENGEVIVVNSDEEYGDALEICGGTVIPELFTLIAGSSATGEDCYTIVYPISGFTQDGGTITISNDAEALDYLSNIQEFYFLDFPVSVILIASGETIEIEDTEALLELYEDCE